MGRVLLTCSQQSVNQCKSYFIPLELFHKEMLENGRLACNNPKCMGEFLLSKAGVKSYQTYSAYLEMHMKKLAGIIGGRGKTIDPELSAYLKQEAVEFPDSDDIYDADYKNAVLFTPKMRFTADRMKPRTVFDEKLSSMFMAGTISNSTGRKSTKVAMGMSAWEYALKNGAPNAGKYRLGGQEHYEWCHLVADSLGGPTDKTNLVAGHYAVNTFMLAIEQVLNNRQAKDLKVKVTAYCKIDYIADFIHYQVFNLLDKLLFELIIDGHISQFSEVDYDLVQKEVRAKI